MLQPKTRIQDAVRRAITFDRRNTHAARQHGEDSHGYLEPLVRPIDEQHKYLELLDTPVIHTAPSSDKDVAALPNGIVKLPDAERKSRDNGLVVPKQGREVATPESPRVNGKSRKSRSPSAPRLDCGRNVSYTPLAMSDVDSAADSDPDLCDDRKCRKGGRKDSGTAVGKTVGADSLLRGQESPSGDGGVKQCNRLGNKSGKSVNSQERYVTAGGTPVVEGDLSRR